MTSGTLPSQDLRSGSLSPLTGWALLSLSAFILLACSALRLRPDARISESRDTALRVYCAAGVSDPIALALADYQRQGGQRAVVARADGSGRLFGQIIAEAAMGAQRGADLFVSADEQLLRLGNEQQIIGQPFLLAIERPVIAASADSKLVAHDLRDLTFLAGELRIGIANEHAAIGNITRQIAVRQGVLPELLRRRKLETENVMQLAQALVARSLDAAVLWDTTVQQVNRQQGTAVLKIVAAAEGSAAAPIVGRVAVGVVRASSQPEAALRLARFLSDRGGGLQRLAEAGFEIAGLTGRESPPEP